MCGKFFKTLTWTTHDQGRAFDAVLYTALPLGAIDICCQQVPKGSLPNSAEGRWEITFQLDYEFDLVWRNGCLRLHPSYTLDEVKDIAQATWEHYIETNVYEGQNT